MKERPILFSAPMVRALLAGTKSQTRRIVKPQPTHFNPAGTPRRVNPDGGPSAMVRCPYGQPGDRLWVRESWRVGAWLHRDRGGRLPDGVAVDYHADNHARREWLPCADRELFDRLVQQSITDAEGAGVRPYRPDTYNWSHGKGPTRWRSGRFMPRWASRITLGVTGVRVERLQDISRGDAMAEGCPFPNMAPGPDPRAWYRDLWEQINGPGSWDANPWVWVVEFKRLEQQQGGAHAHA